MKKIRIAKQKRLSGRSVWGDMIIFIMLAMLGAFMALPLLYAVVTAFKPVEELVLFPPSFWVKRPTLKNFSNLFKLAANLSVPFSRYVFNSLFVCTVGTLGHLLIASMAAYPLAKYKLRINWFFNVIVTALLFNGTVLWLPTYVVIAKLGLINTYWSLIIPCLPMPLGLFLMKQFMEQLPTSVIESACIDGAGQFTILWKIVMPAVKPAWLTLLVFAFQNIWNQNSTGMIFDEKYKTVNVAMSSIASGSFIRAGVSMAGSLLLMIPPILIFVFSQSGIMETMAHSGVKG